MKKEHISDALNMLNDDIIEETNKVRANAKPTRKWVKWGAVAACLCLLVATIPIFLNKPETPKTGRDLENDTAARPSHIIVENRTFFIYPLIFLPVINYPTDLRKQVRQMLEVLKTVRIS